MSLRGVLAVLAALAVLVVSLAVSLFALLVVVGPHGMITLPDVLFYIIGPAAWLLPFYLAYLTWRRLRVHPEGRSRQ